MRTAQPYGAPGDAHAPEGPRSPDLTSATTFAMVDARTVRGIGTANLVIHSATKFLRGQSTTRPLSPGS